MDDRHPIRRKRDDNPYTLYIKDNKYYISFVDGQGTYHNLDISKKLYMQFDEFELDDKALLNEEECHYSNKELIDDYLCSDIVLEDMVLKKYELSQLKKALNTLSHTQQGRLQKYFFEEKTFKEIADEENCSYQAVQNSVYKAIEKIKNFLKNRVVF